MRPAALAILLAPAIIILLALEASACLPRDPQSIVEFNGLKINFTQISQICSAQNCTLDSNSIILLSSFENVALTISNDSIRFRERNKTAAWNEVVKNDLSELKKLGVLLEDDETISLLAGSTLAGKRLSRCAGEWKAFTLDCGCETDTGIEWCKDCLESAREEKIPPEKLFSAFSAPQTKTGSLLGRLIDAICKFLNKFLQ